MGAMKDHSITKLVGLMLAFWLATQGIRNLNSVHNDNIDERRADVLATRTAKSDADWRASVFATATAAAAIPTPRPTVNPLGKLL